jgi:hypothetical protein
MATLFDRIDHFVRWFFNSSPDELTIEPRPRPQVAVKTARGTERGEAATRSRKVKERRATTSPRAKRAGL